MADLVTSQESEAKECPSLDMNALKESLRSTPAYEALRGKLVSMLSVPDGGSPPLLTGADVLLKQIMANSKVASTLAPPAGASPHAPSIRLNRESLYLRVTIGKGAAFVSHLDSTLSDLKLSLTFNGKRFTSPPTRSCMDPQFSGMHVFQLSEKTPKDSNAWFKLITGNSDKVHIACTSSPVPSKSAHQSYTTMHSNLIATGSVDWRTSLVSPDGTMVELKPATTQGGMIVGGGGSVFMKFELVQSESDLTLPLTVDDIERHIKLDEQKDMENARNFYLYAVDWWRQFQEISDAHATREGVRIFAEDEQGTNRCVSTFVSPVKVGRLIDSPRHAARFVSLIPFERRSSVGGRRVETWQSWHAFLCKGRGDVEDHACLLCSLLLGFSLNTYVVIGHAFDQTEAGEEAREHAWVMTISQSNDVTFIESLTGQRYHIQGKNSTADEINSLPYATVSCVFNHENFWANKSRDNR